MKINIDKWEQKGKQLFGPDKKDWKFVCPECGRIQSHNSIKEEMENGTFNPMRDFPLKGGKPQPTPYSECTSPECNYVAYGFFHGPVTVILDPNEEHNVAKKKNCVLAFDFAEKEDV